MKLHRLSYETAGAASWSRAAASATTAPATPSTPRPRPLSRAASDLAEPVRYGHAAARSRQRRMVIAIMLVAHGLAVVGLVNAGRLRDAAVDAKPIFLAVVDVPAPAAPSTPLPPPPAAKAPPLPQWTVPPVVPEEAPAPSSQGAPAPQPAPPPAPAGLVEARPAPAPAIPPRTLAPSEIQYLVPAMPAYSRISAKLRESGKALVRVLIDEAGLPRDIQLVQSTGFSRLDDATLRAVRDCRFKPHLENGVAVAAWALLPFEFELPK